MLLITIFLELCVVAGRSRTWAGSPKAVSRQLCCGLEKNGMVRAWHGKCESDTATLCKSSGKDTF
jgi:hypothetical protein